MERLFEWSQFLKPSDTEPLRSLVSSSKDCNIIVWHVKPGQRLLPHVHPGGQDTWIIQSGRGEYQIDAAGATRPIEQGMIVVAHTGEVHGVTCTSADEPLVIISIVAPAEAGFEPTAEGRA